MKKLLACVGFGVVVCAAGQSPSNAANPGDKWIECFVGKGGMASAEAVFVAVRAALDKGDGEALRALAPDRCASFRIGVLAKDSLIVPAGELMHDEGLVGFAADIKARLFFEEAQLASLPVDEPGETFAAFDVPNMRLVTSFTQRVRVEAELVSIDDRWYLWSRPKVVAAGDRVVSRFRTLSTDLANELRKHKTAKTALRAIDAWWKRRGAELERLDAAARTLADGEDKSTIEALRRDVASALGPLAAEPQVAERLRPVFPRLVTGRVGVPSCDEYLDKMKLCAQKMPPEASSAMVGALDQIVDAWVDAAATPEGRDAMHAGCQAALDAARQAMGTMCPDVF